MFENMQIPVSPVVDGQTQELIAHIQDTLVADQNYAIGDQFIYQSTLYKCTSAITSGGMLVLSGSGANVEISDTIAQQIKEIDAKIVEQLNGCKIYRYSKSIGSIEVSTAWGQIYYNNSIDVTLDIPSNESIVSANVTYNCNGGNQAWALLNAISRTSAKVWLLRPTVNSVNGIVYLTVITVKNS